MSLTDTHDEQLYPNLGFGLGYRPTHFDDLISQSPRIDWLEALGENYIGLEGHGQGAFLEQLLKLRKDYPLVLHFVSTNIGSTDGVDKGFLERVKQLINTVDPAWISDHLCWTGVHGWNSHELLPLPYTEEAITTVSNNIDQVQNTLGRRFMIENTSSYVSYKHSDMEEWEFISEIIKRTDCGLLLDVNNVYVSSQNHDYDPKQFIDSIPLRNVGQIHLAGHITNDIGLIIDTHDQPVCDEVMELYAYTYNLFTTPRSTMIEWDDEIPPLVDLVAELDKVRQRVAL